VDLKLNHKTCTQESSCYRIGQHAFSAWVGYFLTRLDAELQVANATHSNIIASYIYLTPQSPRYWTACLVEGIAILLAIALTFWYRSALIKENKLLDEKEEREMNESGHTGNGIERFRYIY
jgi:hypothetical protein